MICFKNIKTPSYGNQLLKAAYLFKESWGKTNDEHRTQRTKEYLNEKLSVVNL